MTPEQRGQLLAHTMFDELEKIASRGRVIKGFQRWFKELSVPSPRKHLNINTLKDYKREHEKMLESFYQWRSGGSKKHYRIARGQQRMLRRAQKEVLGDIEKHISKYIKNPTAYAATPNAPKIAELEKFRSFIKKNKVPGFLMGPPSKLPSHRSTAPKKRIMGETKVDEWARKIGYGTLAAGGAYVGHKLYKKYKQKNDPYSQVYYYGR